MYKLRIEPMEVTLNCIKLNNPTGMAKVSWSSMASLVFVLILFTEQRAFSQSTIYQLTPKENAFMCPFLTPIFMKELTDAGAEEIRKDQELIIHFKVSTTSALDSAEIYRIAGEVGFQSKIFNLKKAEQ